MVWQHVDGGGSLAENEHILLFPLAQYVALNAVKGEKKNPNFLDADIGGSFLRPGVQTFQCRLFSVPKYYFNRVAWEFKNVFPSIFLSLSLFIVKWKRLCSYFQINELNNRLNMQIAVDSVQAKETPHVLITSSVKTDFGIFLFIWAFFFNLFTSLLWGGFPCFTGKHLHMALSSCWICMLEKGIESSVIKGGIFFTLSVQKIFFFFVHYNEFCCWNCSLVLRIHRRNCVNSKKGVESMKLNWRPNCSKQSPETETFCQKTIVCEWN